MIKPYINIKVKGIVLITVLILISSCSTKKNTFVNRTYHRVTAHYNAYWNGKENFRIGVLQLQKNARDNFTTILPVINYGNDKDVQAIAPNMNKAIEKASKVIQNHSMVFKRIEQNQWVMESYLLIAKANFYKHDYTAAARAFEYVSKQYKYNSIKYEADLWLARTYTQSKNYEKSINILEKLKDDSKKTLLPWVVRKNLPIEFAELYLAQKNYNDARKQLINAIEINKNRKIKTRIYYILAQIYQIENKNSQSFEYFTLALKGSPSYEMAFNAKINMARVYDERLGNKKIVIKNLNKMLNDNKNADFKDQIYYALADIALKNSEKNEAISLLVNSVKHSNNNDYQRTLSAIKLADLYYSEQNYKMANLYYDSTLTSIPIDYPDIENIEKRVEIYKRLTDNLQEVQHQDSLQNLANMSEADRNAVIDKLIAEYIKKEEERKRLEEAEQFAISSVAAIAGDIRAGSTSGQTNLGGGGWYFYNPTAVGLGQSEFKRKWGRRRLEDNWRLSNKRQVMFDNITGEIVQDSTKNADSTDVLNTNKVGNLASRSTYLEQIPLTVEKMKLSNSKIYASLYNAGIIYQDELYNNKKANDIFTKLFDRNPDSLIKLKTCYYLYKISDELNNNDKREFYKNIIITLYPDSDYAKLLVNPEYKKELEARLNKIKNLYKEAYESFNNKLYKTTLLICDETIENNKGDTLLDKFTYLRALSIGKIEGKDEMNNALKEFVRNYSKSKLVEYAQILLGENKIIFDNDETIIADSINKFDNDDTMFSFQSSSPHNYILLLDGSQVNVYAAKVRISDFNAKYYEFDNLSVNSIILDDQLQIIVISEFKNAEHAMKYYNGIKIDSYVFSGINAGAFEQFVISANNYSKFFNSKNVKAYMKFFNKNYK